MVKSLGIFIVTLAVLLGACKKSDTPPGNMELNFTSIDKVLDDSVYLFGGKAYAVITVDGKTVYTRSYGGYASDTKLLIASCSKWLSGAVIMKLVDEGKLALTDTVGKYLPVYTQNGKGKITIAQLFSHTSGFPGNSEQGYENDAQSTLAECATLIAQNIPLKYVPGNVFEYGGIGMQIAGRVAEVASGKSWATLLQEKIAVPSGMKSTDYGSSENPIIAGGARSTPDDYTAFLIMLMNKGVSASGTRVLSEAAVAALEQDQIGTPIIAGSPYPVNLLSSKTGFYGIGNWRDILTSANVLIENSSPGAFGSHPWINRNKRMTGMLFTFIFPQSEGITVPTSLKIRSLARGIVPDK